MDHHFDLPQVVPGVRIIHREKSLVPGNDCREDPENECNRHKEKKEQDDEVGLVFFQGRDIHCCLVLMNRRCIKLAHGILRFPVDFLNTCPVPAI